MSEQTYTITEAQRDDIMTLLQWAEWCIYEHERRGDVDMSDEVARLCRVWDAVNLMDPDER